MAYLAFKKSTLTDIQKGEKLEFFENNNVGTYSSTTINSINTRKYHGLLSCADEEGKYMVVVSSLEEKIHHDGRSDELGTHYYQNNIHPRGYEFLKSFFLDPNPQWIYKTGNIELKKSIVIPENSTSVFVRYEVLKAKHPFSLELRPFIAYRNYHQLVNASWGYSFNCAEEKDGVSFFPRDNQKEINISINKAHSYHHQPCWFYEQMYPVELQRGYDFLEDLYVPGFFDLELNAGDTFDVLISLGKPTKKLSFDSELKKKNPLNTYEDCLERAAQQFIIKNGTKTEISAGYHWFGRWGRDTFIALPGLTFMRGLDDVFEKVCKSMIKDLRDGQFPNVVDGENKKYNSVDASLWFIYALHQYAIHLKSTTKVWKTFSKAIVEILTYYRKGTHFNIHIDNDGLVYAGEEGYALTWMDAVYEGEAATPRIGYCVEINALWYNALCFAMECAKDDGDQNFVDEWQSLATLCKKSFQKKFFDAKRGYLADYFNGDFTDWSIRPNQVFAVAIPYSPLTAAQKKSVMSTVRKSLLTPAGLRTLDNKNKDYCPKYEGTQKERDACYHQGTVWPWLLGAYAEGYLHAFSKEGKKHIKDVYDGFEKQMKLHGIGTVSEIFDAEKPHTPRGTISQAWSISELIKIQQLLK